MPFQYEAYQPGSIGEIAGLIMAGPRARAEAARRAGDAQARAAEIGGQNSAQMWGNLGQIASGTVGQILQQQQDAQRREMQQMQVEDAHSQRQRDQMLRETLPLVIRGEVRPEALLQIAGKDGMDIIAGLESFKSLAQKRTTNAREDAGRIALGLKKLPEDVRQQLWPSVRTAAINGGLGDDRSIPQDYSEPFLDAVLTWARDQKPVTVAPGASLVDPDDPGKPLYTAPSRPVSVPAGGTLMDPTTGATVGTGAAKPEAHSPIYKEWQDYKNSGGTLSFDAYMDRDANRKTPTVHIGQNGQLSPAMESQVLNRLTKDWQGKTAPVLELARQVKLMDAGLTAARRGDLAQGAQTILVTFQKILDPPSVVRESEYMRSAAGQSLVNRVRGAVERLQYGGAGVRLDQLEKFATLAREAARAQAGGYLEASKKRIGLTADHYRIPQNLVFEDFDIAGQFDEPGAAALPPATTAPATKKNPYR